MDIANAFLHAENDEKILMLLRGRLAEMMVAVDPKMYRKYVTYSPNGAGHAIRTIEQSSLRYA